METPSNRGLPHASAHDATPVLWLIKKGLLASPRPVAGGQGVDRHARSLLAQIVDPDRVPEDFLDLPFDCTF